MTVGQEGEGRSRSDALTELRERREKTDRLGQIRNDALIAGEDMVYYCRLCGLLSDRLVEDWNPDQTQPKKFCEPCRGDVALGLLDAVSDAPESAFRIREVPHGSRLSELGEL